MKRIAAVVAGLLLAFFGTSTALATTWTVCPSGCDYTSIQDAINASSNGDVIQIDDGTYYEHSLDTDGKTITIQGTLNGNGSLATTVDAQQGGSVFEIYNGEGSGTVIQDLVITGGSTFGGGIYCDGTNPTITGCTISGNTSTLGGGIYCDNSSPTITGCTISDNTATMGGGISCEANSSPTISGCTISGNTATGGGGISCYESSPTITGCTIEGNWASSGGGIRCENSSPTITDCTISNNIAHNDGGGILVTDNASPTITGCTISDNTANSGGGIYCEFSSNPTITDTPVCGNTPDQIDGSYTDGGGNFIAANCEINVPGDYATIQAAVDAAQDGDRIIVAPGRYTSTGSEVVLMNGKAITLRASGRPEETILDGEGARRVIRFIHGETADTVVQGFTITSGHADNGGGIYCNYWSSPTIADCTIIGNTATIYGGGLYSFNSNPTLEGCTISGNTGEMGGGGLYSIIAYVLVNNTKICGNSPDQAVGLWADEGGNIVETDCPPLGTVYVPEDFVTIQGAIHAAQNGDEIIVAPGTYTSTGDSVANMLGKTITLRASGAYQETILDGEQSRRVIQCDSGETVETIIQGFTITRGFDEGGSGILCDDSSPTISDCFITNNFNWSFGAILVAGGNPIITNCEIGNNSSNSMGAGVYCVQSNATIQDCVIRGNQAPFGAGMILSTNCQVTVRNCVIRGNTASSSGGGLACLSSSSAILDCQIYNNVASNGDGGGVYVSEGDDYFGSTTITNNDAGNGGGFSIKSFAEPVLMECTISDNSAANAGGAFACTSASKPIITYCVMTDNVAAYGGMLFSDTWCEPVVSFSTVCDNSIPQFVGPWIDPDTNEINDVCPMPCADVSGDGVVDINDLLIVLGAWGSDDPNADITGDGNVGIDDLMMVLDEWGTNC